MDLLHEVLEQLPNDNKRVISVLSGGLDSTVLLYLLKRKYNDNVIALSFNYNQKHSKELEKASETCMLTNTPHKIINIDFFGDLVSPVSALSNKELVEVPKIQDVLGDPQPKTYVPYRNMLFTTLALSFAEVENANYVFLGVQSTDLYGYWDTTPSFIERMNGVSELNRKSQIEILAPFNALLKEHEIKIGIELNVPFHMTWSCYNGHDRACGKCPTCAERIKSFMNCNMADPIEYEIDIKWK